MTMTDPLEYIKGVMAEEAAAEEALAKPTMGEEAPEPEEKAEAPEEDPDLDKARAAVQRKYGDLMAGMSPEQIKAIGVEIAAANKRHDDVANELDRLKKAQDSARQDGNGEVEQDGKDAVRPSEESKGLDLTEAMRPLDVDLHGEELPNALAEVGKQVAEHGSSELQKAVATLTEENQRMHLELVDHQVRRDMEERFPDVRDADTAKALADKMALLEPGMERREGEDIVAFRSRLAEHAMVLVNPNAVTESHRSSTRQKGGPRPPENRAEPREIVLDENDKRVQYQHLRNEGKSPEEAKRLVGLPHTD